MHPSDCARAIDSTESCRICAFFHPVGQQLQSTMWQNLLECGHVVVSPCHHILCATYYWLGRKLWSAWRIIAFVRASSFAANPSVLFCHSDTIGAEVFLQDGLLPRTCRSRSRISGGGGGWSGPSIKLGFNFNFHSHSNVHGASARLLTKPQRCCSQERIRRAGPRLILLLGTTLRMTATTSSG